MAARDTSLIPAARIERRILLLRGQKVMLDFHLAELYGVSTKTLNQSVKRNRERFPEDFMFQLSWDETSLISRSQDGTLDYKAGEKPLETIDTSRSQFVTLKRGQHRKFRPYAFTEQGVAMLSSVLRSTRAVKVNIAIMRTFVKLRQMLADHADLARKLKALERKYDAQFKVVFDAIRELMKPVTPQEARREIGFHTQLPRGSPRSGARAKSKASE